LFHGFYAIAGLCSSIVSFLDGKHFPDYFF